MSDAAKNTGTIDRTADKTGGAVRDNTTYGDD